MTHEAESAPVQPINRQLVLDSLTIPERIRIFRDCPDQFTPDPERAKVITAVWLSKLGRDEKTSIADRLADLGIDESDLPFIVGDIPVGAVDLSPHQHWAKVCAQVRGWSGRCDDAGLPEASFLSHEEGEDPLPFEHALIPWVDVATRALIEECPLVKEVLSEKIIRGEQRRLMNNLAGFARFVFLNELQGKRSGLYQGNDYVRGVMFGDPPRTAYVRSVRTLVGIESDGRAGWMERYPALARLLGVRVVAWVRGLVEFVERLEEDGDLLASELSSKDELGALVDLSFGSGDSHNGGRSVAICTFERGGKVVYKPRNGSVDVAFSEVVHTINEFIDPDLRIRVPRTLNRGTWCWAEFITSKPCSDIGDLHDYHRRIGALLAVIHMLQGNDFHLENVMAHGAFPVPIDLETVCVPDSSTDDPATITDLATEIAHHSVLRTMLLPNVMGFRGADLRSMGAIHVEVGGNSTRTIKRLRHINTDFQRWVEVPDPNPNDRPDSLAWTEADEKLPAQEQQSATTEGFESAYRSLYAHREELLGDSSPLHLFSDAWVRVLNRATNLYWRLLHESCGAEQLVSGVDRWIHLQRLGVVITDDQTLQGRSALVELAEAESDALLDGDIAYFIAPGSGRTHWHLDSQTGEPVELPRTIMSKSAVDSAFEQVGRMSESDLALQLGLQGEAYQASVHSLTRILHGASGDVDSTASVTRSTRSLSELVVQALEFIQSTAIDSGGHLNWIDLQLSVETEAITPSALDCNLYGGRGGLGLLYERAYRVFGESRWLETACGAIDWEVNSPAAVGMQALEILPPTGLLARPGIISAAWSIGRHEDHGRYRDFARTLAVSVSEKAISNDDTFDVIGGTAGYILILLGLHQEEALPGIEPLLGRLADHLVAHAREVDGIGWSSRPKSMPMCGLGHGRAGIGLALLEAGCFLEREDLRAIGLAAFQAEHRLRSDSPEQGWPDYRLVKIDERHKAKFGFNAWCSGSEGIALSRAAALQISDAPFLRDDLEYAVSTIRTVSAEGRAHICCGQSGRILSHQTLRHLQAGATLSDDSTDLGVMASVLESSLGSDQNVIGVGMFQGLAGVLWTAMSLLEDDGSDLLLMRP